MFGSWYGLGCDGFEVGFEPIETFFPEGAVLFDPLGSIFESFAIELLSTW
jgi:hypothetical protein